MNALYALFRCLERLIGGKQMSKIEELLYDEGVGLFFRLRDGNYAISELEKQIIIDSSNEINSKIKTEQLSSKDMVIALDLVHTMAQFTREEWPACLANEVYENIMSGIEIGY